MLRQRRYGKPHYGTYQGGHYAGRKQWPRVLVLLLGILLGLALILFGAMQIVIAVHDGTNISGQPNLMVIFGCQVRKDGPSILLRDRLDTALDYLEDHPDMSIVVTGGKGNDEHISEAQAMYDYLTAHGVDGENIYLEDQSRNTHQNISYTQKLIYETEEITPQGEVLLVSSGFHLARIRMLWGRAFAGTPLAHGISTLDAPVSHFPSAVKMFFREPLALVKSFLFDRDFPYKVLENQPELLEG